jgi:hypothetical protein
LLLHSNRLCERLDASNQIVKHLRESTAIPVKEKLKIPPASKAVSDHIQRKANNALRSPFGAM